MQSEPPAPIAIVGLSCRLPAGANSPSQLWSMVSKGRSAWSPVPDERFNEEAFHHPFPDLSQGSINHQGGHFLDQNIRAFDAGFFGLSPVEAKAMDPQQRIQLESAYEALENAGISLESVRGTNTAVYTAIFNRDYDRMMFKDTSDMAKYHMTGVGDAILSNRISYTFDLRGPSMTLDTGCSGSLVALHQACQGLRARESDMALVGGVNLILSPDTMIPMSLLHVLNENGRCFAFDSRGAGYGRGEGVATIVVKRLDDAIASGDPIHAIIRNTGINQDGKTQGIAVPSSKAQYELINNLYASAKIDPHTVSYVEAHGTGTEVGDTAELDSISRAFYGCNDRQGPLYVGSVKSNIGHLESCSGLASLIKVVLALQNCVIPPSINFEEPKKSLSGHLSRLIVPRRNVPWPRTYPHPTRYASVNNFGYGGTNAHCILESFDIPGSDDSCVRKANGHCSNRSPRNGIPGVNDQSCHEWSRRAPQGSSIYASGAQLNGHTCHDQPINNPPSNSVQSPSRVKSMPIAYNYARLFILTAKSEASLRATSLNLASWLRTHHPESAAFADLAYTLCSRRSQLTWRRTISAADSLQLEQALSEGFAAVKSVTSPTKSLFTFTGQGAQHYAMGRELLQVSTTFRDSLLASDRMLKGLSASWSIIDELQLGKSDSRINESRIAQPCVTALQIALVDLLHSLGIRPNAVIGHSSGEIAAAYAAGALSQAAALQVAFHRGRISDIHRRTSTSKGAMLAVGLGEAEASKFCLSLETAEVKVACINSPLSTTLSGDEIGISQLQKTFDDNGVFNRKLDVDLAYHSHHMEQPAIEYRGLLDGLAHKMPKLSVQFISSVTGKLKTSGFGPAYWVENLVSQVRFSAALEAYRQMHDNSSGGISQTITHNIIEIGPHSALSTPVLQTVSRSQSKGFMHAYYPSLVKGRDAVRSILDMTGKLFAAGLQVDLTAINALDGSLQERSVLRDLPPYAWDHSNEFWHESRLSIQHRLRPEPHHDLLGDRVVDYAANDRRWRNLVSVDALPWLRDHVVDDFVTFPGSAYVCMALEALKQVIRADRACGKPDEYTFCDVEFLKALIIPDLPNTKVEVNLSLTPCSAGTKRNSTGWEEFRVCSWSEKTGWSQNCHGFIIAHYPSLADGIEVYQERDLQAMSQKKEYSMMNNASKTRIDSTRFYEELEASGNKYGKNFATLKNIRVGDTQAVGNVTIPNPAENMHTEVMQPHTIHPATLDALLHSSFPISSCDNSAGSIMIVSIKEFTISADTNNQPGHLFHVGASVSREDARSSTATILVFEGDQNSELRPVISLSGELRAVGEKRGASQNPQANKAVVYQMKWDRDVDFITGDHCFSTSRASPLEPGEVSPEEKQAILNQAASVYIHDCLRGMTHQKQDISVPHMHLLYKWMERFSTSEEYQQNLESPSRARTSLERLETLGVEGELLQRVGGQIKSLLTGRLDPLACLLEDGLLHRFYAEDESLTRCCAHLVTYLELAIFKNPQMKVLEVGAGTGGTTLSMLKALTKAGSVPFEHYGYTDISSGFFGDAKEKLKDWSEMVTFKTLNIEEDPTQQGFDEGSYDMVIASNVIHATERIRESVGNVRKLLKPGGKLALVEVTRFDAFVNLIFGVLPGWWRGREEGRIDSPVLSVSQWNDSLSERCFTGVDIAANDFEGRAQRSSMMISTALAAPTVQTTAVQIIHEQDLTDSQLGLCHTLSASLADADCQVSVSCWEEKHHDGPVYVIADFGTKPLLRDPSNERFHQIKSLLTRVTCVLWVVLAGTSPDHVFYEGGLVTGFSRVARSENETLKIVTLDLQRCVEGAQAISAIADIFARSFVSSSDTARSCELDYAYKDGQIVVPRLIPEHDIESRIQAASEQSTAIGYELFHQSDRPLQLHVGSPGSLDSLVFDDCKDLQKSLAHDELEIHVEACGLNFKDVFIALGRMRSSDRMAGECAGYVVSVGSSLRASFTSGDKVCAWNATPYASRARVAGTDVCLLPDSIPYTIAASIPVVFATAYYSIVDVAKLRKGQTILVHAASGGVGQAALIIAQWLGAEVFLTVGSAAKRDLIAKEYHVPATHIFSSRALNFKRGIMRLTKGNGVDVILNSSSGEALQDTWECIASFGTFVEIGKSDIYRKSQISMAPFDRHVSFVSVDLTRISHDKPEVSRSLLAKVVQLFENGTLRAIEPVTVMPMTDIEGAFRKIQSRSHVGKLVLQAGHDTMVKAISPPLKSTRLEPNGTYVVAGGLGSLGRPICRFIASRGAKNILILSRRFPGAEARAFLQREVESLGARVMVLQCDITDLSQVSNAASRCQESMPPAKGLINCVMVIQDSILEHMDGTTFSQGVNPKLLGTCNLNDTFSSSDLDFFVMLSSISGILGFRSQANYAAGNTFQDAFAQAQNQSKTRYTSLNLGMVIGSEIIATSSQERLNGLHREGGLLLGLGQVLALLEYSMAPMDEKSRPNQLVMGFDRDSLAHKREITLCQPIFSHVAKSNARTSQQTTTTKEEATGNVILTSGDPNEVNKNILRALVKQVATIMAMDEEKVDFDAPTADLGLDSLIAVELKNWIRRAFQAAFQTSEILDMSSIRDLAIVVGKRSRLVSEHLRKGDREHEINMEDATEPDTTDAPNAKLPVVPLSDLADTIALYQESVSSLLTDNEAQQLNESIQQFLAPDGLGQRLQCRLRAREADTDLDGWLPDLYNAHVYLKSRAPVNPFQHFYGSHAASLVQHSQAERAAIIAAAAIEFKTLIDTKQVAVDMLNEQALCMDSLGWLFNASREPHVGEDEMRRFPGHDYAVVLRDGHYFKMDLKNGSQIVSFSRLLATFQAILEQQLPRAASVAALTAASRDTWAEVREHVKTSSQRNHELLEMLDAAAFVVCLDSASPSTASERCHQFLYGDPCSRWSDKTLQFVVCPNGVSAYLCEHAAIDGGILAQLNQKIKDAILNHDTDRQPNQLLHTNGVPDLRPLTFISSPEIDAEVSSAQELHLTNSLRTDYVFYRCDTFGGSFLRSRRCAPKSGFQIIIQLAALYYFGYNPPSWETVSMRPFHKGRVDIYQSLLPPVKDFCDAAKNAMHRSKKTDDHTSLLRPIFDTAVRAHANLLTRVSQGRGFAAHLYALQEVIAPDEAIPSLFSKDSIYTKTRPGKLMTDCAEWLGAIQDGGFAMPDPEFVWVHYEVDESGCDFAIRGPEGRAGDFIAALKGAVGLVKEMLDRT